MYQRRPSLWSLFLGYLAWNSDTRFTELSNTCNCNVKYRSRGKSKFRHLRFGSSEFAFLTIILLCIVWRLIPEGTIWSGFMYCRTSHFAWLSFLWRRRMLWKQHTHNIKAAVVIQLQKTYCKAFLGKNKGKITCHTQAGRPWQTVYHLASNKGRNGRR